MYDPKESAQLFKCLADASRLQILSGLVREPMYVELIAERLALSPSTVSFHLKKLEAAGLVTSVREQYYVIYSVNGAFLNRPLADFLARDGEVADAETAREEAYRQKVVDAFFSYGRLKTLPAQQKKRRIVLEEIARRFEAGKRYPEREVNLIISEVYDDFCTLRREMVDCLLMKREQGEYWLAEPEKEGREV